MKTPAERQARNKARRKRIVARITTTLHRLDADDKDALSELIRRAAEILSDGEVTAEEKAELRELLDEVGRARENTPDE